jgi:hypothetical protein
LLRLSALGDAKPTSTVGIALDSCFGPAAATGIRTSISRCYSATPSVEYHCSDLYTRVSEPSPRAAPAGSSPASATTLPRPPSRTCALPLPRPPAEPGPCVGAPAARGGRVRFRRPLPRRTRPAPLVGAPVSEPSPRAARCRVRDALRRAASASLRARCCVGDASRRPLSSWRRLASRRPSVAGSPPLAAAWRSRCR